jgi:hypothetical protein
MCTGFFPPGGGGSTGGGKGFAPGRGGFWLAPGGDNRNVNEIFTRGGKYRRGSTKTPGWKNRFLVQCLQKGEKTRN